MKSRGMDMKKFVQGGVLALALVAAIAAPVSVAVADILIMPIRIVFQPRDRMHTMTVMNTSDKSAVFRISLHHQKQTETGGYEQMEGPIDPAFDPAKMIVYSPRQIHLPPGGKQAIRISARRPAELPDGEYRIHMRLERESSEETYTSMNKKPAEGIGAQLNINVGFSIPVILRQGKYDATVKITEPRFVPASADGKTKPMVEFYLDRSGLHGSVGHAHVFWTPAGGGEEQKVGVLNGLNVFSENPRRKVKITLSNDTISGGSLRIVYEGDDTEKGIKFDEATIPL